MATELDFAESTIAELFARAPNLTPEELDRIIADLRTKREHFKVSGKPLAEKKPVNLEELGLL